MATIWFTVDFERYPGARLCTFDVLDEGGNVIGTQRLILSLRHPSTDLYKGRPTNAMEVTVRGSPAGVTVECDPRRLDTPGIAEIGPFPADMPSPPEVTSGPVEPGPAEDIIHERVREWSERFGVDGMSSEVISANLAVLGRESARLGDPSRGLRGEEWWVANELWARIVHLRQVLESRGEAEIRGMY